MKRWCGGQAYRSDLIEQAILGASAESRYSKGSSRNQQSEFIHHAGTKQNNKFSSDAVKQEYQKHTTVGIQMWLPTILLTYQRVA
jgi:hypothetical protein